jgi:hypothetical protein
VQTFTAVGGCGCLNGCGVLLIENNTRFSACSLFTNNLTHARLRTVYKNLLVFSVMAKLAIQRCIVSVKRHQSGI